MEPAESLMLEVMSGKGAKYRALRVIGEKGQIDRTQLAEEMKITPQAAGKILSELSTDLVIVFRHDGNRKVYFLSPLGWLIYEGLLTATTLMRERMKQEKLRRYLHMRMRDAEGRLRLLKMKLEKVKGEKRKRALLMEIERVRRELSKLERLCRD